jgi:transposase-like protein
MPKSFKDSRRWSVIEAEAALKALSSSGLSLREFARREGLDHQRLRAWRQKLGSGAPVPASPAFIEISRRPSERVEVLLPSGVILRIVESIDTTALRRIAAAFADDKRC